MDSNFYEANDDLALPYKRFKVCFVTGIWQRPEIVKMFIEGIKVLQDHFKHRIEITCAVAGSEGVKSRGLIEGNNGFHYVEVSNNPLGVKMNAACALARSLKPDYCLMLGSDDLIGVSLMRKYLSLMEQGIEYAYLTDCYFFDTRSKRGLYWGGYTKPHNKGHAAGIGRLLSSSVMDKMNWVCFPPGFDKVLDSGLNQQLRRVPCMRVEINLKKENLFALDIKSSTNMTPFFKWDNTDYTPGRELLFNNLPEYLAKKIYG